MAGSIDQENNNISIGNYAGQSNAGLYGVNIGAQSGAEAQGNRSVAIGLEAGRYNQGCRSIAIGEDSGKTYQNLHAVAIGYYAGQTGQGHSAVAIGLETGQTGQKNNAVAIGVKAGEINQGVSAVAVGNQTGQTTQGSYATAVGYLAGETTQGLDATAMGHQAGRLDQGEKAVAIGYYAGNNDQGTFSVAVGRNAAETDQGSYAVAVGGLAGNDNQANFAVAIGNNAGSLNQGCNTVAIGVNAALETQGCNAVAIGKNAGREDMGVGAIAIGQGAGYSSMGNYDIAIGYEAQENSSTNTGCVSIGFRAAKEGSNDESVSIGKSCMETAAYNNSIGLNASGDILNAAGNSRFYVRPIRSGTGSHYLHYNSTNYEITRGNTTSDDRLKSNETFISDAIKSLFKVRPQKYLKAPSLEETKEVWTEEAGVIAQELYYSAPEFRHLVELPQTVRDIDNYTPPPSDDPTQDPDYSMWGPEPAGVKYEQFVPYLIKGVQEIVTELPRSKTTVSNTWGQNITGLVVCANQNTHKTNTIPIVTLSNTYMDKAWYGVVSDKTTDTNDYDTLIDKKGETRIWVTDVGGPLESGDLLTTSNIAPGHTQKQLDDVLHSYTVAKITQDCDFTEPVQRAIRVPRRELSNVTYYTKNYTQEIAFDRFTQFDESSVSTIETVIYYKDQVNGPGGPRVYYYDNDGNRITKEKFLTLPENERSRMSRDEINSVVYERISDEEKAEYTQGTLLKYFITETSRSKTIIPEHDTEIVVQEIIDVLDDNEQIVWENTSNTIPEYSLVDHGTYKAALVSCTLI
jgi:hypothetical protein